MDELKLKTELVNGILQYLGGRPFVEVAGLIQAIQQQALEQGAVPAQAPEPAPADPAPAADPTPQPAPQ